MSNFTPPVLDDLRKQGRDYVTAQLPIRGVLLPNSPMRVMSDNSAGLAFLVLLYLQNVADNLLPDKANLDWLTRWANIYLQQGPKPATFATRTLALTGTPGTLVPSGTVYQASSALGAIQFQTTADTTLGSSPALAPSRALEAGSAGNLGPGTLLSIVAGVQGADPSAMVATIDDTDVDGVDAETVEELRIRVLNRIQKPPMGGDADDYVAWALEVPGVTRAWCAPNEMGPGSVTLRFMMDDLRASSDPLQDGFPTPDDVEIVRAHVDTKRPVAIRDLYCFAPIPEPIDYTVALSPDSASLRAATEVSVASMLRAKGAPNFAAGGLSQGPQTIYAAWVNDAILNTAGIDHLDLSMSDHVMPSNGAMAVPGSATYA